MDDLNKNHKRFLSWDNSMLYVEFRVSKAIENENVHFAIIYD